MSGGADETQEKLLGKLQWLTERSRRDFKGNPPPFEKRKTQHTVEQHRKHEARLRAGDTDFLPFWHGPTTLAIDARRWSYLRGADNSKFERRPSPRTHQRIDPESGLTEIQRALCWDAPRRAPQTPPPSQQTATEAVGADRVVGAADAARRGQQRPQRCTRDILAARAQRWNNGTQLDYEVEPPPRRCTNSVCRTKRNAVRLGASNH